MKFSGLNNKYNKKYIPEDISSDEEQQQQGHSKDIPSKTKTITKEFKLFKPKKLLKKNVQEVFEIIEIIQDEIPKINFDEENLIEIVDLELHSRPYYINKGSLEKVKKIEQQIIEHQICSICLSQLASKKGKLQCNHIFCLDCIINSSKFSTSCPYCRQKFAFITFESERIQVAEKVFTEEEDYLQQPCYICGRNDNQNQLLVCDRCNFACCHIYCDERLNNIFPTGNWYCLDCEFAIIQQNEEQQQQKVQEEQNIEPSRNLLRIYRMNHNLRN